MAGVWVLVMPGAGPPRWLVVALIAACIAVQSNEWEEGDSVWPRPPARLPPLSILHTLVVMNGSPALSSTLHAHYQAPAAFKCASAAERAAKLKETLLLLY